VNQSLREGLHKTARDSALMVSVAQAVHPRHDSTNGTQ